MKYMIKNLIVISSFSFYCLGPQQLMFQETWRVVGRGLGWEKLGPIISSFNHDGIPSRLETHTINRSFTANLTS